MWPHPNWQLVLELPFLKACQFGKGHIHMPEVIPANLVDLLYHVLAPLPQNIWHAVSITDVFQPTLQMATGLNEFQYETRLLAVGFFRGEE